ncbi:MAG: hypothetical protein EOQ50_18965 [Mesorhizobium sp.]|uniref:hypothetical protein n=1 Tax=Mesorhizobium sp. TaxID=1871066 RepID=UPI000FEA80BC|nr:hypothetical protein [Mesorhizobium sp.]RWB73039.1 MAG: hypothetical protein EOQ50_18965 [Mesorhizobium sp.]RWL80599.1 MAG: hypothetical protein EOR69_21675 [Mesorhizobium sp.]RWL86005.1 MAG: hypothetical protein EOR67_19190 [Mesorhizobium sp.]RWL97451.1 MAG: hypothetical protein EOR70_15695 [Mesorhizobium sp.]TIP03661.1 MAG: hypothetical protein E5X72_15015 [Mesorhizobium sp.]
MILYFHPASRGIVTTIGMSISSGRVSAAAALRRFVRDLFDPYRPELHYMRGPGPRWREKNDKLGVR